MLRLLRALFLDHPTVAIYEEDGSTFLEAASLLGQPGKGDHIYPMAERFAACAVGVLHLMTGAVGQIEVKSLSWRDAQEPSKSGSVAINILRLGRREADLSELLVLTQEGETAGAALIGQAERDPWLGEVCAVVASDGGWPDLYMLLELLRDHYAKAGSNRWPRTFAALCQRHGQPEGRRLEDLKETANFHRHALIHPPARPWQLPDAWEFVRLALKAAIAERDGAG